MISPIPTLSPSMQPDAIRENFEKLRKWVDEAVPLLNAIAALGISAPVGSTPVITNPVEFSQTVTGNSSDGTFTFNSPTFFNEDITIAGGVIESDTTITASYYASTISTGTAPYQCNSTTLCTNLNAQLWGGKTYTIDAGDPVSAGATNGDFWANNTSGELFWWDSTHAKWWGQAGGVVIP